MRTYRLRHDPGSPPLSPTIDYGAALNESQMKAVETLEGPVLVVAGAGTGKTRTLVYRVARLVDRGIPPEQILLLTFTRRAAEEMLRRASALIDGRCDRVQGGTFHSVAYLILRKYGQLLGYPPAFTIMDRSDAEDVIQLLRGRLGLSDKEKRFPRKTTLADMLSKSVNRQEPLESTLNREYPHFFHYLDDLVRLQEEYTSFKREKALLDYDDLLVQLTELLSRHEDVRERLSQRYRYILVDEYQDTNKIQSAIIRLLAFHHDNVMVVGDDAQSIYSFRGANFRNIMDFPQHFPGTRIIPLEENYRSTPAILEFTNAVIEGAREKYTKHLFSRKPHGERPALVQTREEREQSRFVCQKVLELREEGVPLGDMAVLFRSSFHSFDLEIELGHRSIPFVKRGGLQFIETSHVKDTMAHLRVLLNPADSVSWHRILQLIEGIGPRHCLAITDRIQQTPEDPVSSLRSYPAPTRSRAGLSRLCDLLSDLWRNSSPPSELLSLLLYYYEPILQEKFDNFPKRARDLEHLVAMSQRYRTLEAFLADVALEPPTESVSGMTPEDQDDEKLILSTIHSAKGLEWHTVFILWAVDGKFPSPHSLHREEDLEEERRLMYVASTRASRNLFILFPLHMYDHAFGHTLAQPSVFLRELPSDLVDFWTTQDDDSSIL
ncbi:MAG: ATP-dependent helicase [Candidatus Tectomicrobia bacterium]|uniref:DNA 3'-5' helicase n=1 Tax=Tectimicrobiota bacterium TaxID=2528274 RepID=A0A932GQU9_UNCTE|nr:ATP-dependent helicase [Candidatus Tectomicrobia bacterium]